MSEFTKKDIAESFGKDESEISDELLAEINRVRTEHPDDPKWADHVSDDFNFSDFISAVEDA